MCVTRSPRASISAPIDAEVRPLPIEETTPPVTSTNLVCRLTAAPPASRGSYHASRAFARLENFSCAAAREFRASETARDTDTQCATRENGRGAQLKAVGPLDRSLSASPPWRRILRRGGQEQRFGRDRQASGLSDTVYRRQDRAQHD